MTYQFNKPDNTRWAVMAEEDLDATKLASEVLREAGFTPVCLNDGYEALDFTRSAVPELVITEIVIPRLDGLALCRLVKRDPALSITKVLVLSADGAKERALAAGADAFLPKPLDKPVLMQSVRSLTREPVSFRDVSRTRVAGAGAEVTNL
jgi:two-component system response regulator MprA